MELVRKYGKRKIAGLVDRAINDYLEVHENLRVLFNENSGVKDVICFFANNHDTIYSTIGRILHGSTEIGFNQTLYSECLNSIDLDYKHSMENKKINTIQKRMIVATMIELLTCKDFSINDLPIDKADFVNNDGKHWYRGQSDYTWHLTPSMFRNLSNVFTKETSINIKTIEQIYSYNGILKKWEDVFKEKKIDYKFLSYMQHSISYSPLLDFTADFPTAVSFSLSNRGSVNDFAYKDSAVFEIEVEKNQMINAEKDDLPAIFSIDYIPQKYIIGTSILGKPMLKYDDIITALTPKFVMIDTESNDRMRYQRGNSFFSMIICQSKELFVLG